jgi:aminodeoxyfutalosine deaminase
VTCYRARWILPISGEPIPNASVTIADGRIVALEREPAADAVDLGDVVVLPSLVNAHVHLELSHLRGVIPRSARFIDWIRPLMAARRDYPDPNDPRILAAAGEAIAESRHAGTGIVADVTNTLVAVPLLRDAGMPAHVFYELLGFSASDPEARVSSARARLDTALGDQVRGSLAPHAPYSVSPAFFAAIRADLDRHANTVSTVHLGESAEEIELVRRGTGAWRALLEELGVWSSEWKVPGASPVGYLEDLGFLDSRVLTVHGVQFSGEDLTRLRALDVTVVSCPRSNQYVGVGSPPLEAFYAMDVDVAFGTDSLASVFSELAEARRLAPRVAARTLLESATLTGACALGFDQDFGSIDVGKRASLIGVHVPAGVSDVEEYLVSGIQPSDIRWLDS